MTSKSNPQVQLGLRQSRQPMIAAMMKATAAPAPPAFVTRAKPCRARDRHGRRPVLPCGREWPPNPQISKHRVEPLPAAAVAFQRGGVVGRYNFVREAGRISRRAGIRKRRREFRAPPRMRVPW